MDWSGADLHIDYLTVSQLHPCGVDWGQDRLVRVDLATGRIVRETVTGAQVTGSFRAAVRVRCVGGRVEVSGNPSKWGRLDAVGDGCRSMGEALGTYNDILAELGLPLFSIPDRLRLRGNPGDIRYVSSSTPPRRPSSRVPMADGPRAVETVRQGPIVTRVDIAGCIVLGSADSAAAYTRWVGTQRAGKKRGHVMEQKGPESYCGGTTRGQQLRVYSKGPELAEALRDWRRRHDDDRDAAVEYLTELSARATAGGWVRREVQLGRDYLRESKLRWAEEWGDSTMSIEFAKFALGGEGCDVGAVNDWRTMALGALMGQGLTERSAQLCIGTLSAWMSGFDPRAGLSQATYYRRAKQLREALGVEIRSPPNVVSLGSRIRAVSHPVVARPATREDVRRLYSGLRAVA